MSKNEAKIDGNDNIAIINTNNSNITVNYNNTGGLSTLLTNLPEKPSLLLGRENKIKEVEAALESNKKAVIVNGFGGIGKTSIASYFFHEKTAHYSHKAWLRFTDNLVESYFTTPLPTHFDIIRRPEIPIDITIGQLITKLENIAIDKKCLLVIDNVESADSFLENEKYLPKNWDILVTSRAVIEDSVKIFIDVLDEDDSIKLFKIHLDRDIINEEIAPLKELLSSIGRHTLTIELLAKIAKRGNLSIDYLLERWNQYSFTDEELDYKINTGYKPNNKRIVKLKEILNAAFDLSNISSNESSLKLLKFFVILPKIENEFTIEKLEKVLGYEKHRELINNLQNLTEIGWLQTVKRNSDEKDIFFIHPLIQEVLLDKLEIEDDLIVEIASPITEEAQNDVFFYINKDQDIIIYLERIQKIIYHHKVKLNVSVDDHLALSYEKMGRHEEAYHLYKKILERNNEKDIFPTIYSGLATTCMSLGKNEEAHKHIYTSIEKYRLYISVILRKNIELQDMLDINLLEDFFLKESNGLFFIHSLLAALNEYGRLFLEKEEYEESNKILSKVALAVEYFRVNNYKIAKTYIALGRVNIAINDIKKAKINLFKAREKYKNLVYNHTAWAGLYYELSIMYSIKRKYEIAENYGNKALEIEIESFGKYNPQLLLTYCHLSELYLILGNINKAFVYIQEAEHIITKYFIPSVHVFKTYAIKTIILIQKKSLISDIWNSFIKAKAVWDNQKTNYTNTLMSAITIGFLKYSQVQARPEDNNKIQTLLKVYEEVSKLVDD